MSIETEQATGIELMFDLLGSRPETLDIYQQLDENLDPEIVSTINPLAWDCINEIIKIAFESDNVNLIRHFIRFEPPVLTPIQKKTFHEQNDLRSSGRRKLFKERSEGFSIKLKKGPMGSDKSSDTEEYLIEQVALGKKIMVAMPAKMDQPFWKSRRAKSDSNGVGNKVADVEVMGIDDESYFEFLNKLIVNKPDILAIDEATFLNKSCLMHILQVAEVFLPEMEIQLCGLDTSAFAFELETYTYIKSLVENGYAYEEECFAFDPFEVEEATNETFKTASKTLRFVRLGKEIYFVDCGIFHIFAPDGNGATFYLASKEENHPDHYLKGLESWERIKSLDPRHLEQQAITRDIAFRKTGKRQSF